MSQVICSALKAADPRCQIDLLAPPAALPLASRMAEVRAAIPAPFGAGRLALAARYRLGRRLASQGYARALVTPNSFKSALVPFFAEIPQRTGYLGEYRYLLLNDLRLLDKRRLPQMAQRFLALAAPPGAPLPEAKPPRLRVDKSNQQALAKQHGLDLQRRALALCPGAEFGDAKRWPLRHFAAVAKAALAQGHAVWILGSAGEAALAARLAGQAGPGCVNLAGKTSLADAIDLLALCRSVVCNDSGLMHIAAAVGARVIALYGSTSPAFTPPLTAKACILTNPVPCSPCFQRRCPLQHKQCLEDLPPSRVLAALEAQ